MTAPPRLVEYGVEFGEIAASLEDTCTQLLTELLQLGRAHDAGRIIEASSHALAAIRSMSRVCGPQKGRPR